MVNVFALIIVAALLLEYVLDLVVDLLNLHWLKLQVPAEFQGLYKPDDYRKSQEYTRVATRFGLITDTFKLAVLLAFWFSGGFNFLDSIVRAWAYPPIVSGLIYTGIIMFVYELLMLPFEVYDTFVIEGRFGFNRTTPATFVTDRVKGLGLAVVLGGPLLAAILALFQYAGPLAWVYCWIAASIVSLLVDYIAPTWIMPLFNKFTPMPPGELKDAILGYARSVNFPVENVFVMNGSQRSTRGNAFFTGLGRNKRIALFDTLIAKHTTAELVAVLAHEIGHYKKKHVLQGTIIGIVHEGVIFFLLSVFLGSPGLYQAFYMDQPSIYAGLIFFGLLYTPVEMVFSIVLHEVSRWHESQADRFAADTIEEPRELANALKKLSADNLSNLTPHPFYVFLHYSHPPLLERVRAVQRARSPT